MAKRYTVAGETFDTQGKLEARVKAHLNSHPTNAMFCDPFLAAVVNEHHPDVARVGAKCLGVFEYLTYGEQRRRGMVSAKRFRGGKLLLGVFATDRGQGCAWYDVTVYPWRRGSPRRRIKAALREKAAGWLRRPVGTDRCEVAGCGATGDDLELHHERPTFDEMARECLALMADEEIDGLFGYDKFAGGQVSDAIPDDHPAVVKLFELHESADLRWLCKLHHRNVGRGSVRT